MIKLDAVYIGTAPNGKKHMAVDFEGTPIHTEAFTRSFLKLLHEYTGYDPDGADELFRKIKAELDEDEAGSAAETGGEP